MSRTFDRMEGGGLGGVYIDDDEFNTADANQAKQGIDIIALGEFFRGEFMGGSKIIGLAVTADGDYDLPGWQTSPHDNTGTQLSGFTDANGATRVFQARVWVRVSDVAVTATPKFRYGAAFGDIAVEGTGTVATISGAAGCTATTDDFSGTNQYQIVTITQPTGVKHWKPQITVSGTGGNPYTVWVLALLDSYIQST